MEEYTQEISLRELIETMWRGRAVIAVITIVALVVTGLATYLMIPNKTTAQAIVEFNYPGIEKGENPDGTAFDIQMLRAPYVIDNAINSLGYTDKNLDQASIRKNIEITPIVPNDVLATSENMIKQGKEYVFYPSKYKVVYKINREFSYNEGLQLISQIQKEYEKYFYEKYSDMKMLDNIIGNINYQIYDYPEIIDIMKSQLDNVEQFLSIKNVDANNFRSSNTGYTFSDLLRTFEIIEGVSVDKLESIVNTNNLTKDKDNLIKTYEFRIKQMTLEMQKKESEALEAQKLMKDFKKDNNYVLIPESGKEGTTVENPYSYYDVLAQKAIEASVKAEGLRHDVEYYKNEIELLSQNGYTVLERAEIEKEVNQIIAAIGTQFTDGIELVNTTLDDYYNSRYGKAIFLATPPSIVRDINILMNMAIALILGLMVGIVVVFTKHYWKNSAKEIVNEGK